MIVIPPAEQMPVLVGALVAALGGPDGLQPAQASVISAVTGVLGGEAIDPSAVEPVSPDELAAVVDEPAVRHQLLQAMVALAFMEHPPAPHRDRSIGRYADALGVDEAGVGILRDYAHDHTRRMLFDTFRYMPMFDWERHFAKEEGIAAVARSVLATFGKAESPVLVAKFTKLEGCPVGSLGRRFWEMYDTNGWPFPGQKGGVPEGTSVHDWVHILAGYDPTPIGEIQVTAFITAPSPNPRLFGAMVLALGLYEAGAIKLPQFQAPPHGGVMETPNAGPALADALRRGVAVNTDLMEGIDHWALANEPVGDLRTRFNVVAKDEPTPTSDPGV